MSREHAPMPQKTRSITGFIPHEVIHTIHYLRVLLQLRNAPKGKIIRNGKELIEFGRVINLGDTDNPLIGIFRNGSFFLPNTSANDEVIQTSK